MGNKKMDWVIDNRNHLFFGMCYGVHFFLMILFAVIGIWGVVVLNAISIAFYTYIIAIRKDFSENAVVASYFEIVFFATGATIMLGRQAGFLLYIVGMISVVFYLAYHHQNKRFIYQLVGVFVIILLAVFEPMIDNVCLTYKAEVSLYARELYIMNLVITLTTILVVSFLYAQDMNRMNHQLDEKTAELDYKATHDQLTGLWNRHEMNQYIDEMASISEQDITVAMMDVDDFKLINDTYGHDAGDMVLRKIARLIESELDTFKVARWGGEEFLAIGNQCLKEEAKKRIGNFHHKIQELNLTYEGNNLGVSLTIGLMFGKDAREINHLILEADDLLYTGKNSGKNQVLTFENVEKA